jgi:hypothetical protein
MRAASAPNDTAMVIQIRNQNRMDLIISWPPNLDPSGSERSKPGIIQREMRTLYLINADEPWKFEARKATIIREHLRIGETEAVVVSIEPPLDPYPGGPLASAILAPRHRNVSIDEIRNGPLHEPANVFVCRFQGLADQLPEQMVREDVVIALWGLLSESLDFKRHT